MHKETHKTATTVTLSHRPASWNWSRDHLHWTFRTGNVSIGQTKVIFYCAPRLATFQSGRIETMNVIKATEWAQQRTATFGCGGVTVCGCISFNCTLDSHFLQGNVNIVAYYNNVLSAHFVPHFSNRPLADMPIFMYENTRPLRACIVRELRSNMRLTNFSGLPCPQSSN